MRLGVGGDIRNLIEVVPKENKSVEIRFTFTMRMNIVFGCVKLKLPGCVVVTREESCHALACLVAGRVSVVVKSVNK